MPPYSRAAATAYLVKEKITITNRLPEREIRGDCGGAKPAMGDMSCRDSNTAALSCTVTKYLSRNSVTKSTRETWSRQFLSRNFIGFLGRPPHLHVACLRAPAPRSAPSEKSAPAIPVDTQLLAAQRANTCLAGSEPPGPHIRPQDSARALPPPRCSDFPPPGAAIRAANLLAPQYPLSASAHPAIKAAAAAPTPAPESLAAFRHQTAPPSNDRSTAPRPLAPAHFSPLQCPSHFQNAMPAHADGALAAQIRMHAPETETDFPGASCQSVGRAFAP